MLTDGLGDATIDLVMTRLETDQVVLVRRKILHFQNRLAEVRVLYRIGECVFPAPGEYQFTLLVDGQWVAQRNIHVAKREA